MNNRRRLLVAGGASALIAPFSSFAQQQGKVWRIGFLGPSSSAGTADRVEAVRAGLRELGYVEGKNLLIEIRSADDRFERLPGLAEELVRLKPDVVVTHGVVGVRAMMGATNSIPIVMCAIGDALAAGLVTSLARPGGNLTGTTFFSQDLHGKRIELLKEAFPRAARFAFLVNAENPVSAANFDATKNAVKPLKVELQRYDARAVAELDDAFSGMARAHVDAVAIQEDPVFIAHAKTLAGSAAKRRLPLASGPWLAEAGGFIGYGPSVLDMCHRAGYFVDRIFKGANPADLPVERPTRFALVVNMKTAKALGTKIPQSILARADRVIE